MTVKRHELLDVAVVITRETHLAVLVDHGGRELAWLPKSEIEIESNGPGRGHTVTLPQWLAEEKGIA